MRVALYARVSTLDKGQDVELQLSELRDFARQRGFEIVREYVDRGVSGAKESRPALNELMSDAGRRKFDAVLVWKLDRFARSVRHLVNALAEFDALKVSFISLRDNIDLTTPAGRLMFHVIAAMAEFERCLIAERVRAGMKRAQAKGKRLGQPRLSVDTVGILQMQSQGRSLRAISRDLGISDATVRRRLASLSA